MDLNFRKQALEFIISFLGSITCSGTLFYSFTTLSYYSILAFPAIYLCFMLIANSKFYRLVQITFLSSYILFVYSFIFYATFKVTNIDFIIIFIPLTIYLAPIIAVSQFPLFRVELFVICWLFSESTFNLLSIGGPFLNISNSLGGIYPAAQWLSCTGGQIASGIILITCYLLYKLHSRSLKYTMCLVMLIASTYVLSIISYNSYTPHNAKTIKVANIARTSQSDELNLDSIIQLNADIVLTPESMIDIDQDELAYNPYLLGIKRTVRIAGHSPTLFLGANIVCSKYQNSNSIIIINKDDNFNLYAKQQLTPFGEYIPWVFTQLGEVQFPAKYIVKKTNLIFSANGIKVSPMICYEGLLMSSLSYRVHAGAELITISASNEYTVSRYVEYLITNITRINAIISKRTIVRSTTDGICCTISNVGKIESAVYFKDEVNVSMCALNTDVSIYLKHSELIELLYLLLFASAVIFIMLKIFFRSKALINKY